MDIAHSGHGLMLRSRSLACNNKMLNRSGPPSTKPCTGKTPTLAPPSAGACHIRLNKVRRSAAVRGTQGRYIRRCSMSAEVSQSEVPTATADGLAAKTALLEELQGIEQRGIFGLPSTKREEVKGLVNALERHNPLPSPTENLNHVAGEWRLLYTTVQIMGSKRTKLGLRGFVSLGDFVQRIDVEERLAVNEVGFKVMGLGTIEGALTIEAAYEVSSPSRVDIEYKQSSLVPQQLQKIFEKNLDLLLAIFNPEGWLELTYVDDNLRIGLDDKDNIFVLERM